MQCTIREIINRDWVASFSKINEAHRNKSKPYTVDHTYNI